MQTPDIVTKPLPIPVHYLYFNFYCVFFFYMYCEQSHHFTIKLFQIIKLCFDHFYNHSIKFYYKPCNTLYSDIFTTE